MTGKELKRMSRMDLLELTLELTLENEKLRAQLQQCSKKLASRRIEIENAGSIAEAALQLNGIFAAAQAAADQYLENLQNRVEEQIS